MASAGRTLGCAALSIFMLITAACAGQDVERSASCEALDALGVEITSFQELLVWPGIRAARLHEATEDLEAEVAQVDDAVGAGADMTDIVAAFGALAEAVYDTVPPFLAQERPEEPVQMAAHFITNELEPLVAAHARALGERC